jgi:pSer/pThr/pTyr-binding forkhead associated (FHA) protein
MTGTLRPRVVLFQGSRVLAVREVPADHEWYLGRRPDSPLPLDERSVSRQHARLYCDGAGTHLEDLGTPNGTWIDGTRLRGTALLRDGQVIRLGQSTNTDPLLLRFEDPASRLLDALARAPVEAAGPVPAPAAHDAAGGSPSATASGAAEEPGETPPSEPFVATVPSLSGEPSAEEDTGASGALPAEEAPAPPARPFFGLGAKAIFGAVLAFVGVFWLLWALKSTQKPWQSVRVEPLRAQVGSRVAVRGSEVEPADSLKVFLEDREAHIEEATPGQLVFTVPALAGTEAGTRAATLRVERQGIVVLRQTVQYETTPSIKGIEPTHAAVGDVVALVGGGFAADPSIVQVRVGGVKATVVSASAQRLEVRVPVVTRDLTVEAPVEVVIEGLTSASVSLTVKPRADACFALSFSARPAGARVFEVWHDFGPILFVQGAAGAGAPGEPPAAARQAVEALKAAFARAAQDPSVRFEVLERGKSPALVATGQGASPRVVTTLGPAVRELVRERLPELGQPELVLYWNALVLNEMLNLFVKKQPPRLLPASEPLGAYLRRLNQLSLETGGRGCPAEAEMKTTTDEERRALESAFLRVPPRFGDVAGVWVGTFESSSAGAPSGARLEMQLELEQSGTALTGRVFFFEVRGPGIRWSPAPIEGLTGRVRLDNGTRVELRLPPGPPHDIVQLSGTVAEDVMEGTYRTIHGKQGPFQLSFKATP